MYPNSCHKNSTHFIGNFVTITISPVIILFCGHLSEFQSFSFKIPFLLLNSSFVAWVSVYLQFLPSGSQLTHCLARASSLPTFHYANRFKNAWRYNILIDVDVFCVNYFCSSYSIQIREQEHDIIPLCLQNEFVIWLFITIISTTQFLTKCEQLMGTKKFSKFKKISAVCWQLSWDPCFPIIFFTKVF